MLVVILKNYKAVVIDNVAEVEVKMKNEELVQLCVYDEEHHVLAMFLGEEIIGFYPTFTTRDGRDFVIG